MNECLLVLFTRLPAVAAVCFAGYLAILGKDGWGWFLFIALLLGSGTLRTGKSAEIHAQADLERAKQGLLAEDD